VQTILWFVSKLLTSRSGVFGSGAVHGRTGGTSVGLAMAGGVSSGAVHGRTYNIVYTHPAPVTRSSPPATRKLPPVS
jgi:hypothetical protein